MRHSGGACNGAMRPADRKRRREATQLAAVSSFAWSLTFDVRVGREYRLLQMVSARHLRSHSRREELRASLAGEKASCGGEWARHTSGARGVVSRQGIQ